MKLNMNLIKLISLSNGTIINRMKEFGFQSAYPIKKPLLTEEHKRKRLQFALDNYDTDWTTIIFSDETTIVKGGTFLKKRWVGMNDENIIRTIKHPIKRNLFGCISIGCIETFKIFKNNLNSNEYIDIPMKH